MAETVYRGAAAALGRGGSPIASSEWLFTGEDQLRIGVANSLTGVTVSVQGRFLPLGKSSPEPFRFFVTPTSDRMMTEVDFPIGVGYLLNVSAIVSSGAPLIGQTYIMLQIIRGFGAKVVLGCLLGGYVTASQHLAYPGSPIQSSIEGGGVIRSITGTAPAAGAEWVETVPTGARWQLQYLRAALTTDGTAGARWPALEFASTLADVVYMHTPLQLVAGQSRNFMWGIGMTYDTLVGTAGAFGALPVDHRLLAGFTIRSRGFSLAAGDQWTTPIYVVQEWLEVA